MCSALSISTWMYHCTVDCLQICIFFTLSSGDIDFTRKAIHQFLNQLQLVIIKLIPHSSCYVLDRSALLLWFLIYCM